jgi:hypothetical protein
MTEMGAGYGVVQAGPQCNTHRLKMELEKKVS